MVVMTKKNGNDVDNCYTRTKMTVGMMEMNGHYGGHDRNEYKLI